MYFLWTGPMWPIDTTIDGTCSDRWYTAILYVNNIFDIDGKLVSVPTPYSHRCMYTWHLFVLSDNGADL